MQTEEMKSSFDPNKLYKTDPSRVRFPERFLVQEQPHAAEVAISPLERSVVGYYELEDEYKTMHRILAKRYKAGLGVLSDEQIRELGSTHLAEVNESRIAMGIEPIEHTSVNLEYIKGIITAAWLSSVEDLDGAEWDVFVQHQNPKDIRMLKALRATHNKLAILSHDETLMKEVKEVKAEQATIYRLTAAYMTTNKISKRAQKQIDAIYAEADLDDRQLLPSEEARIREIQLSIGGEKSNVEKILSQHPQLLEAVKEQILARMKVLDKRQLEHGLLVTESMQIKISELMVAIGSGNPVLLVGETGGAKTAIAEYLCREILHKEPELISGFGDVNTYQLIGKTTLEAKDGVTASSFVSGPLLRAMEKGVPVILDEINAMPPEILKRLNKIMQLRPGDVFIAQEDGGREVVVQPGFCIIATANEKSKRYKGVDDLSTEFENRFGANIVRIHYPDRDVAIGQLPPELFRLAATVMTDDTGKKLVGISSKDLISLVKVAHFTQQLFTANYSAENLSHMTGYLPTDAIVDADHKPGLEETVIAPRTLVDILLKIRASKGRLDLKTILGTYVEGVKNSSDRKIINRVLHSHGLL